MNEDILPIVTKYDYTNVVRFKIEGHTLDSTRELHHLTSLDLGQTEDSCNTITNWYDWTEFFKVVLNKFIINI